jgi:hypothetical protein
MNRVRGRDRSVVRSSHGAARASAGARRLVVGVVGALAIAAASAPTVAHAGTSTQEIETAETAYVNLDYGEANRIVDGIVKRRGLTHDELVRAYRVLALSSAVLEKPAVAKAAFIQLLTYDPSFHLDANLAPRVQAPFFEALGYWRAQSGKPGVEAVASVRASTGGTLRVVTRDPTHVTRRVIVGYRWNPGVWIATDVNPDEVTFEIPAAPPGSSRFDYYVQALDGREDEVFVLGSAAVPKVVVVDARDVPPIVVASEGHSVFKSPVFWTITGIVVAGAATTAVILLAHRREEIIDKPATTGNLTPALTCKGGPC